MNFTEANPIHHNTILRTYAKTTTALDFGKPTAWMPIDKPALDLLIKAYRSNPHPKVIIEACLCNYEWLFRFAPHSSFGREVDNKPAVK